MSVEIERLQEELDRLGRNMETIAEALGTTREALLILERTALIELRTLPILVSFGIDIQYVFTGVRYDHSEHSIDVRAQSFTESSYNTLLQLTNELEEKSRHKKLIRDLSENELKENDL